MTVRSLAKQPAVQTILTDIPTQLDAILDLAISIQQIPAPTFEEAQRASFIEMLFREVGLQDVSQDGLHNVFGCLPGAFSSLPPIVISAHSDTVFPAGTDLTITRNTKTIHGPGIADNSMGVAGIITLARLLKAHKYKTANDIWFVSNVGEEGLGDLRGMRAVVERFGGGVHYVVVEGGLFGRICHQAIGVRRYRLTVTTPGGHSWGAFGNASAIHELAHIIASIDGLTVPSNPKTTYNVGVIEGGTSINTIANQASLLLDLRSEDPALLADLVEQVKEIVAEASEQKDVQVEMEVIGDRPAGQISQTKPIVQFAASALRQVGSTVEYTVGSTDANIPLSKGMSAVCIGLTRSANTHRPDEFMEIGLVPAGIQQLLLLTLALAEMEDMARIY